MSSFRLNASWISDRDTTARPLTVASFVLMVSANPAPTYSRLGSLLMFCSGSTAMTGSAEALDGDALFVRQRHTIGVPGDTRVNRQTIGPAQRNTHRFMFTGF